MPSMHRLLVMVLTFAAPAAFAEGESPPEDCIEHQLSAERVNERLVAIVSSLPARWGIETVELSPCVSDDGIKARVVLSLPKGWSNTGVFYRVRLSIVVDRETGAVRKDRSLGSLREVATALKGLLSRVEQEESVRNFYERYSPLVGWIESGDNGELQFDLQPQGADSQNGPRLFLRSKAPGYVVGYQLHHIDGLPVRQELLRFVELVSLEQPGCIIRDIRAQRQETTSDEKEKKAQWMMSARLHGNGCQSRAAVALDENGNKALNNDD